MPTRPLVIDLDGTLTRSDALEDALVASLRHPARWPGLLAAARQGRARLKRLAAEQTPQDPATLPYSLEVLELIATARAQGRPVVLATGADHTVAKAVAAHLGGFDQVFASDGETNLTAERKAALLEQTYGRFGFDYVGDSAADIAVARVANTTLQVESERGLARFLAANPERRHERSPLRPTRPSPLRTALRALRPAAWVKSALVALPLLAAHRLSDPLALSLTLFAAVCFSLAASSVYLVNDALDAHTDRQNTTKRRRPIAAGWIRPSTALLGGALLAVGSLLAGLLAVGGGFALVLAVYLLLSNAYSLGLKRSAPFDTVLLSILHLLRIFAGGVATGILISDWLIGFGFAVFWCMALAKRIAELDPHPNHSADHEERRRSGRGWIAADRPLALALAAATAAAALVVLLLYVTSPDALAIYREPRALLAAIPLVAVYLSRLLLAAGRGELHGDPIVYGLRDRGTYLTIGGAALLLIWGAA